MRMRHLPRLRRARQTPDGLAGYDDAHMPYVTAVSAQCTLPVSYEDKEDSDDGAGLRHCCQGGALALG